jgi:hypothetical protein
LKLLRPSMSALASLALLAGPVAAQAKPAPAPRAADKVDRHEALAGFGWGWYVLILLIAGGVYLLVNQDEPTSP